MKNFTEHKIDHDFSNTRIDRWFRQYFEGLSHNNLEKYLRKGFIRVNEKKIRSSYRLNKGDIIKTSVFINNFLSNDRKIKKIYGSEDFIKKNTLHIDNDLLVINKPFNLADASDNYRFKGEKTTGEININITDDEKKQRQKSLTKYKKVLKINDNISWIAFRPITGRTHQIRKHASMSNFPIVGDKKYGNKNNKIIKINKIHLHSHSVDFKGLNGDILHFEAPLPDHMMETWVKYNLPLKPDNDFFIGD